MNQVLHIDKTTQHAQLTASDPANSAWVSANAGSGKTYVLAQRVVRLLLAGVDPSRILCLTYTKAAAGEMSNRVFEILGKWVVMDDADLRAEIERLEKPPARPEQIARARILFARALETPGGLKIQTIHAFCEALLHQFPLEANVPGTFTVMDDLLQRQLMGQARRSIALTAFAEPDSPTGAAFLRLMESASDAKISKVLGEIVDKRDELADWLTRIGGPEGATEHARKTFGFEPQDTVESITHVALTASLFHQLNCREIAEFAESTGATKSIEFADDLRAFGNAQNDQQSVQAMDSLLLTKEGKARSFGRYPSKAVGEAFPQLREQMAAECDRWLAARSRIHALQLIDMTEPLLVVAGAMIGFYGREKRKRGMLDFDDLIERTADLLSRSDARSWVLYKLDLGIDHVLLDEAQDTSPIQWQIISALVEEFFAGHSARQTKRTIFAVGDEKQSIYSFRGAEPRNFAAQKSHYLRQARAADTSFADVPLNLSFRSTADVLGAVDAVFSIDGHAEGVTFGAPPQPHSAARRHQPGSVDVWDLVGAEEGDDPQNWHTPMDFSGQHQALLLAEKIARQVASWIGNERLEASGNLIGAGDILVLVRARDRFVGALNRALKARGIAVSGADRLIITDHIAVQDLIAIGQVVLTPSDDLSLAVVLKSPLIGLGEEDVFDLTQSRFLEHGEISLFEALQKADQPQFAEALGKIDHWRAASDRLPVFEFYAQIVETMGGRKQILSRLGSEAEDVLDAFLDIALAHEQTGIPGLQAFLSDLLEEKPEIKREMDASAGEVRIMTVHAAKGLEAPIVFLVDKSSPAFLAQHAPSLYGWSEENQETCYLWVPNKEDHCDKTRMLRDEEKRRAEEEYRRLLYVGMTRAKDRLIVCGYRGSKSPGTPNWHAMVCAALEPDWQDVAAADGDGELLWHRWKIPESPATAATATATTAVASPQEAIAPPEKETTGLPDWITRKMPVETRLPRPLTPSGAQTIIDESLARQPGLASPFRKTDPKPDMSDPRRRGTVLHQLLQLLPDMDGDDKWQQAETYLARQLPQAPQSARRNMLASLKKTLDDPQLQACFDPATSRAEVSLMGTIASKNGPRSVSGQIDRLAVLDEEVVIVDYKTNLQVPSSAEHVPPDYVTQMALYRHLVERLYPEKMVQCLLVWTHAEDGPAIMELDSSSLEDAYRQIAQL